MRPEPVRMHMPKWYKDVPVTMSEAESSPFLRAGDFTIKKCLPVLDYLTSGYMLRFTTEVAISPEEIKDSQAFKWEIPMPLSMVDTHPHGQFPIPIDDKKRPYIRFNSEYIVRTPPGYSCLVYQPMMHFEKRFTFISAIIDTDTYDGEMKATGWINSKEPFVIEMGTPMMVLFPFKRENWKMEISDELFSVEKSKIQALMHRKFYNLYKQYFHKRKKYE